MEANLSSRIQDDLHNKTLADMARQIHQLKTELEETSTKNIELQARLDATKQGQFFVFVEGGKDPRIPHADLRTARQEAHRLLQLNRVGGQRAHVMQSICSFVCRTSITEIMEDVR